MRIERRIEKAEAALNLSGEPVVHQIVLFGDGPLPPERRDGNTIVQYVRFEDMEKARRAGEAGR